MPGGKLPILNAFRLMIRGYALGVLRMGALYPEIAVWGLVSSCCQLDPLGMWRPRRHRVFLPIRIRQIPAPAKRQIQLNDH